MEARRPDPKGSFAGRLPYARSGTVSYVGPRQRVPRQSTLSLTWRCSVTIRRLVLILGLATSLVSPASAQNPGALHWRQKTGLGVMLAGVVAIGVAHERHAPDPLRRLRPIGGGLVVTGAVVALLPVPEPVRPDVAVGPAGWTVGKTWSWGAVGRDLRHNGAAGAVGDLDRSTTLPVSAMPATRPSVAPTPEQPYEEFSRRRSRPRTGPAVRGRGPRRRPRHLPSGRGVESDEVALERGRLNAVDGVLVTVRRSKTEGETTTDVRFVKGGVARAISRLVHRPEPTASPCR